jgi:hypothetical protein
MMEVKSEENLCGGIPGEGVVTIKGRENGGCFPIYEF